MCPVPEGIYTAQMVPVPLLAGRPLQHVVLARPGQCNIRCNRSNRSSAGGAHRVVVMQSQMGASNTPTCISAIRDAYKSCTRAPTNSARPVPTHTPVHLQAGSLPSLQHNMVFSPS